MFDLIYLLSQYELLESTAHHLSTLDLYNIALTCSDLYSLILNPNPKFEHLKREALCDGHGLQARQNFLGPFNQLHYYGYNRKPFHAEEIEVRIWNTKCDEANGLPCLKCGVNVCEECRFVPRVRDMRGWESCRRPHHNPAFQNANMICYCNDCDQAVQERSGESFCDCNQYTRWICFCCKMKEQREAAWYAVNRTKIGSSEWPDDSEDVEQAKAGMCLWDHQCERLVFLDPLIITTSASPHQLTLVTHSIGVLVGSDRRRQVIYGASGARESMRQRSMSDHLGEAFIDK